MTLPEMILALQEHGYIVHHKSEGRVVLSWNRADPVPEGVDFRSEAVEKIRQQVVVHMLDFEYRADVGVHTARLRIL